MTELILKYALQTDTVTLLLFLLLFKELYSNVNLFSKRLKATTI